MTPDDATLHAWADRCEAIGATTKRLEKVAVLVEWLPLLDDAALAIAARFLSGLPFARHDMRTTQVGGSILHGALQAITGTDAEVLHERYVRLGDTGSLAEELFAGRPPHGMTLEGAAAWLEGLSVATGSTARRAAVTELLSRLSAREAKYLVRLLAGELRIGLKEAQVEEALARAFAQKLTLVRHANLLRGDIGEVAVLARGAALASATLAMFHPIGFMLAQPLPTAEDIAEALPTPFVVEDKYDGIRAQLHVTADRAALYSRTLDEISRGYPEVVAAAGALLNDTNDPRTTALYSSNEPRTTTAAADAAAVVVRGSSGEQQGESLILDGELLAYDPTAPDRALPFLALQRRLGRKAPTAALIAETPVAFVAYDIIAVDGALVVEEPWQSRRARLEALPWTAPLLRLAPARLVTTAAEVDAAFDAARAAGNEGLIAKDPASPYTPGRRGKAWIKLKKATETLDVVITGAEWGHGRRRKVLSDYTFAVRASADDETLLNVGKAYNGLTDIEIAELTPELEALTTAKFGRFQQVTPQVVLEVTFDIVQPSKRHKAGFALRFPRILRIRRDKTVADIDVLDTVRRLAEASPGSDAGTDAGDGSVERRASSVERRASSVER